MDIQIESLRARQVLVTGASRGLGRTIALAFAKSGASLIIHGRSYSAQLEKLSQEIHFLGAEVETWVCDFNQSQQLQSELNATNFAPDILILNASLEYRENIRAIKQSSIESQFNSNLLSSILLAQHFSAAMCEKNWGRIIGIGSIQEQHANPDLAVYAALKCAQTSYLKTLSTQLAAYGVTVNSVAPGAIATDRNREILEDPHKLSEIVKRIPAKRVGEPQDCVGAVLFLASESASYVSGANIAIDGGFLAK